ncbi:MAG: DUF1592 domain-containing protein [Lentisphaeraceae bacterium]|nr:DUF1592 domain-containing protein [Lentisphaeraceae bacterium]
MKFPSLFLYLFYFSTSYTVFGVDVQSIPQEVKPVLEKYCYQCHNAKKQKGDLRLDNLDVDYQSFKTMAHWEEIMFRVNSADMPPEDEKQPTPSEKTKLTDWINSVLHEYEAVRQKNKSNVSFKKLSGEEYAHTVFDLLNVRYDPDGEYGLPEDSNWHGFKRISSVLTTSPFHIEKHHKAASFILDEALPVGEKPEQKVIHWSAFDLRWKGFKKEYERRGIADKVRIDIVPNNYTTDSWDLKVEHTGEYLLKVKLSGLRPEGGKAPRLKIYLSSSDQLLLERDVEAPEDKPVTLEKRIHLTKGTHRVRIANSVPGPNPEARRSRHTGTPNAFTSVKNRVPWQLKLTDDDFKPIEPVLIIDSLEWTGPIHDTWPTKAQKDIFFTADKSEESARQILQKFAQKAWRRPVNADEVEAFMDPFKKSVELGESFEAAIKSSLTAIMCSNSFLYLEEGSPDHRREAVNAWEFASRLSYFLWASLPDEELMELAESGKIFDPEVLNKQIDRMMKSPKIARFVNSFPEQWLQLDKVGMFPPDPKIYKEYDENLEKSMVKESINFFKEILERDMSILEFLDSDWLIINERLAEHYQIENIKGDFFRKVKLPENHLRGGLLTQGSILSMTSDGTRHRPVHRGVWVLESVLGTPPPPPPANVPGLETEDSSARKKTIREILADHRKNPDCNSCHKKIDPYGLAFDSFDAVGRDISPVTKVDSSGVLTDGRTFENTNGLKKLLIQDADNFALAFVEKLATDGLRRGMSYMDRQQLKEIVEKARTNNFKIREMIRLLITSPIFVKR